MCAFDKVVVVRSVPSEMLASIVVSHLEGAGIEAWSEGGITSGYRAEAPGYVNVLVRESDVSRAAAALASSEPVSAPSAGEDTVVRRARRALWFVAAWIALAALVALWLVTSAAGGDVPNPVDHATDTVSATCAHGRSNRACA